MHEADRGRATARNRARKGCRGRGWVAVVGFAILSPAALSGCGTGVEEPPPPASAAVSEPAGNAIAYQVDIDGVEGELNDLLRASSELLTLQETPPLKLARLPSRAKGDGATSESVLRSRHRERAVEGTNLPFGVEVRVRPALHT